MSYVSDCISALCHEAVERQLLVRQSGPPQASEAAGLPRSRKREPSHRGTIVTPVTHSPSAATVGRSDRSGRAPCSFVR